MKILFIVSLFVNVFSVHLNWNNQGEERIYLYSNQSGNLIWGGAMDLAWNELKDQFVKENIKFETNDTITLRSLNALNGEVLSKNDLEEKDYYIKSGYGQQTVNLINQQLHEKFPENSFGPLKFKLNPKDIVSLAYFMKKIKYLSKFSVQKSFNFSGKQVKGFIASGQNQRENINLHNYQNDDNFLISLKLIQNDTQLFLYKSNKMFQTFSTVAKLIQNTKDEGTCIQKNDKFGAPQIHLNFQRQYSEMLDKKIINLNLYNYTITKMFQKIKFDMDNQGVKIQNLAVITIRAGSAPNSQQVQPKRLLLNKPYWIVMKNKNKRPFFIAHINVVS